MPKDDSNPSSDLKLLSERITKMQQTLNSSTDTYPAIFAEYMRLYNYPILKRDPELNKVSIQLKNLANQLKKEKEKGFSDLSKQMDTMISLATPPTAEQFQSIANEFAHLWRNSSVPKTQSLALDKFKRLEQKLLEPNIAVRQEIEMYNLSQRINAMISSPRTAIDSFASMAATLNHLWGYDSGTEHFNKLKLVALDNLTTLATTGSQFYTLSRICAYDFRLDRTWILVHKAAVHGHLRAMLTIALSALTGVYDFEYRVDSIRWALCSISHLEKFISDTEATIAHLEPVTSHLGTTLKECLHASEEFRELKSGVRQAKALINKGYPENKKIPNADTEDFKDLARERLVTLPPAYRYQPLKIFYNAKELLEIMGLQQRESATPSKQKPAKSSDSAGFFNQQSSDISSTVATEEQKSPEPPESDSGKFFNQ